MRSTLLLCLGAGLLLASSVQRPPVQPPVSAAVTGILVKFPSGILNERIYRHAIAEIDDDDLRHILEEFDVKDMHSVFKNRYDAGGRLIKNSVASGRKLMTGWFELIVDNKVNAQTFISELKQSHLVLAVQANQAFSVSDESIPDDVDFWRQWHLSCSDPDCIDIDAPEAWDINRGRNDVIVAVLDGGVDYTHPELDPGDRSRVITGIDVADDDDDPMDGIPDGRPASGHGTKMAGVIGARANNQSLIAGVMWNCKIMPVKVCKNSSPGILDALTWGGSSQWSYFPGDVADGLDYAVSHGAHVIAMSYSMSDMGFPINDIVFQLPMLYDALENAYQNNVVITTSMGNAFNEDNGPRYPAAFDQVIAVGNSTRNGTKAGTSNTGPHIDIAAPGTSILTTTRDHNTMIETVSGTSFSSPMVAGVAGLIISQAKDRNFAITNDDVKQIMTTTATDIAPAGFDEETGFGVVNAHHALQLLATPNILVHGTATGGTSTHVRTFSLWTMIRPSNGLAAGTYASVEQHRVNRHVTFPQAFCAPPARVWMRDRQTQGFNGANPNPANTHIIISNVTATGFDVEYFTYLVHYALDGKTVDTWVPTHPTLANVAWTAIGVPNRASNLGLISGPPAVCAAGGTFTLPNVPADATVTWQASPAAKFVTSAGTGGSATLKAAANTSGGQGTITFNVTATCGTISYTRSFWYGSPDQASNYELYIPGFLGQDHITLVGEALYYVQMQPVEGATSYNWVLPAGFSFFNNTAPTGTLAKIWTSATPGTHIVKCYPVGNCGSSGSGYQSLYITIPGGGGTGPTPGCPNPPCSLPHPAVVYPNPTSELLTVSVEDAANTQLKLYNERQELVLSLPAKSETTLSVKDLPQGTYYLNIVTRDRIRRQKILVKH